MGTLRSSPRLSLNSRISLLSATSKHKTRTIMATINIPKRVPNISLPGLMSEGQISPFDINTATRRTETNSGPDPTVVAKLWTIMEAVADRVEMHRNIGDQRNNWNTLMLTSINALTIAAAAMAGISASCGGGAPATAMKISSTAMYVAATGMLSIVNKIQPSQLAEEQRNAVRLFEQLRNQIQTVISIGSPTAYDVGEMTEKVLALDRAYPLPLLGAMLEKFPARAEPAVWWPQNRRRSRVEGVQSGRDGWNEKLEKEMREIADVIGEKDKEEYLRLEEKALRLNKFLAVSGPVLTGLAAVGAALAGSPAGGDWAVLLGVLGGAVASAVNVLEHGGQVGMVVEMYRSNAGFFQLMEETVVGNLREEEPERRDNGEIFELKVGLQLGRSLSELRRFGLAEDDAGEFASKLF